MRSPCKLCDRHAEEFPYCLEGCRDIAEFQSLSYQDDIHNMLRKRLEYKKHVRHPVRLPYCSNDITKIVYH